MKYMGSKRSMLQNGLGKLIIEQSQNSDRFVDLFCGAGYVSWFVAENTNLPVYSIDLQSFSVILSKSIIGRDIPLQSVELCKKWLYLVEQERKKTVLWKSATELESSNREIAQIVADSRNLCLQLSNVGPIWNAYGGYYFSPTQALTIDYMISMLPENENEKIVCLAAIISTATKCVAAPGHTAQPFQPTKSAGKFIEISWGLDPITLCEKELTAICPRYARKIGSAIVADALEIAPTLKPTDLVFIDPPYSDVQYSRFYHVLETIARSESIVVSGVGRYPPITDRPQSTFSRRGDSLSSLRTLLTNLRYTGATLIFTFPKGESSNGLSGDVVRNIASEMYSVQEQIISGRFSTLGGNNSRRSSRVISNEMILTMKPR